MLKYRISRYGTRIERAEIERETEKTVWIVRGHGPSVQRRKDGWELYFDTWEGARNALLARCESRVNGLRIQLMIAEGDLGNVKGMKPPTE